MTSVSCVTDVTTLLMKAVKTDTNYMKGTSFTAVHRWHLDTVVSYKYTMHYFYKYVLSWTMNRGSALFLA